MKLIRRETAKAYKELEQRMDREEKLSVLQRKMELRALLRGGKNKPLKILKEETKSSPPVYVWAKERKRWRICEKKIEIFQFLLKYINLYINMNCGVWDRDLTQMTSLTKLYWLYIKTSSKLEVDTNGILNVIIWWIR